MAKHWFVGAAVIALMSNVAFADDITTHSSTTTNSAPIAGSYGATQTQSSVGIDGTESSKSKSYKSDAAGTSMTEKSHVSGPDGSQTRIIHKEQSSLPTESTTTTTHSTTRVDQ
jgi:hypothetical protein